MAPSDYLTVTALTTYIARKFSADPYMREVYVAGEVSNFRQRPTHQYFSLKDDGAKINVAMFKSAFAKVKFQLEDGMRVLAVGRITVYPPTGNYQMTIERLEPDGVGALYAAFQQLNENLQKEGLYQVHNAWPLRQYPQRVAVVTSPSGAVIQDIMTTVKRRYPQLELVLFPTLVQGDKAADDIVRQLHNVDLVGKFDAVIVGRGGGSIEDLWPFNEERVARAIAAMHIPVVSSVGHETDVTIADYVADYRAATPTAAAEYVTPVTAAQAAVNVDKLTARLVRAETAELSTLRARLNRARGSVMLTQPARLYDNYVQRLDQLRTRLANVLPQRLGQTQNQVQYLQRRLAHAGLVGRISQLQQHVDDLATRNPRAALQVIHNQAQRAQAAAEALDHLSPLKTMARGYGYVTDPDGRLIARTSDFKVGATAVVHVTDGTVTTKVKAVTPDTKA
ncbi:exodeoxyribonuclease VII large subunit [Lacticaseibacillus sharpeae]|uniref:Exodeoxyribonuclease 7 large subunit n=1 Tax=Lacticaseibacillus sharpeae JCM 1186 = DSM 20505 TaxID=1291052 RepID=A0A0R1ZMV2_9LACO|nr:exodeoxyribonuclease VII large subunit [Lacticaseibacillus sharpeae]KRM56359.1 exodeoxyribonuclease vii, large subunit [Lacticaseibacillus sharpeae JCM 1186 = DSM 20505]